MRARAHTHEIRVIVLPPSAALLSHAPGVPRAGDDAASSKIRLHALRTFLQRRPARRRVSLAMATFGKSDKNSRDLHIGYGTNYPLELTQPIGPGPASASPCRTKAPLIPGVLHARGRPNARLAMDRSPGPAQYAVPQHVLRKGAKKASGPRLGHARRFTAGMLGGADAQLIAHSVGSEQEFDVSSMASLASLESSVGEQSASLASEPHSRAR